MKVLAQAEKLVTPSKKTESEKTEIAETAFELVRAQISRHPEIKGLEFGGSYPKGTWMPENSDVDIFIKFGPATPEKKFAEVAKKVGFAALKKFGPYVRFSDHPYVEARIGDTAINVVPCYVVKKGQWKSAADRSRFHTEFMRENLTEPMKTGVRLLKQFLKNNALYGSEIAQQGFGGYVAEVLVLNFGSFENVIREMAGAKSGRVIGRASKKFETPITIMDPVDAKRNLAAAISNESMGRFVLLCRAFAERPSVSFFKGRKKRTNAGLLKNCVVVRFGYRPRSPDIIWGQLKRAANSISVQLELEGFTVIKSGAHTDGTGNAAFIFLLESVEISKYHVKTGPEFFGESDSGQFIKKNASRARAMWMGGNRIMMLEERAEAGAKKFLVGLLSTNLERSGMPKGIREDVRGGFRVSLAERGLNKSVKKAALELVSTDARIFSSN